MFLRVSLQTIEALLLLLILSSTPALSQSSQQSQKSMTVAVLDFEARDGITPGEAASLSDLFSALLVGTEGLLVVDRSRVKAILEEQGFQQSEACSKVQCVVEAGKILKAEKIFAGTIGKVGRVYNIIVQLINVSTALVELTKTFQHQGEVETLASEVLPELAHQVSTQLTGKDVRKAEIGTVSFKGHPSVFFGAGYCSFSNEYVRHAFSLNLEAYYPILDFSFGLSIGNEQGKNEVATTLDMPEVVNFNVNNTYFDATVSFPVYSPADQTLSLHAAIGIAHFSVTAISGLQGSQFWGSPGDNQQRNYFSARLGARFDYYIFGNYGVSLNANYRFANSSANSTLLGQLANDTIWGLLNQSGFRVFAGFTSRF